VRLVREAAASRSSALSARRRRPTRVAPCRRMPQLDVRCADRIGRFTDEAPNYSEIGRIGGSTERRDRTTTVALQTSAQNGTSRRTPSAESPVTSTLTFGQRAAPTGRLSRLTPARLRESPAGGSYGNRPPAHPPGAGLTSGIAVDGSAIGTVDKCAGLSPLLPDKTLEVRRGHDFQVHARSWLPVTGGRAR